MSRGPFDRLHTVRLVHESRIGCTEVCRAPDGTRWVRLQVYSTDCQREILNGLDESIPVRLENNVLEMLLPFHEGISLREWIFEQKPALGQRRDVCLSLLEQQIENKLPPCIIALSANPENLVIAGNSMFLQSLPELRRWELGMTGPRAVCALAGTIYGVLSEKTELRRGERTPEELFLIDLRQKEENYTGWDQLQRDVAAIPDAPPRINLVPYRHIRRIRGWLHRYGRYILRALAALLFTVALLSLFSAYRRYVQNENQSTWQGMPLVGDQNLRNEEGGE
ncbi:MAG: hypothetical protein HFF65_02420 [Oscillospiraceae bacterium]|jgi:hypothetical protein|nr:hypothetical protein [Oscillospiraceae bacterium]